MYFSHGSNISAMATINTFEKDIASHNCGFLLILQCHNIASHYGLVTPPPTVKSETVMDDDNDDDDVVNEEIKKVDDNAGYDDDDDDDDGY